MFYRYKKMLTSSENIETKIICIGGRGSTPLTLKSFLKGIGKSLLELKRSYEVLSSKI